jgi:CRP-like cAMP-binding protein
MRDQLAAMPLFQGLPVEKAASLADLAVERRLAAGESVFHEGDDGDEAYVVLEGTVRIVKRVAVGIERTLALLPAGALFGEAAIFDREERSASAVAETEARLALLPADPLRDWLLEHSDVGALLLGRLGSMLMERLRATNDQVRDAIQWGAEVAGASRVGLERLVQQSQRLRVQLITGREVEGLLVKAEAGPAGLELSLSDDSGLLHIIRYDAIAELVVPVDLQAEARRIEQEGN